MGPDSVVIAAIVGGACALGGSVGTYLIAKRNTSGNIITTTAERLWSQNEKLIDAYQEDNGHLRKRLQEQDARMLVQDQKIWDLTKLERDCTELSAKQSRQIERLERMLKVDLPLSPESNGDILTELGSERKT